VFGSGQVVLVIIVGLRLGFPLPSDIQEYKVVVRKTVIPHDDIFRRDQ